MKMDIKIQKMLACFSHGDEVFHPSNLWQTLNSLNSEQLEKNGIENIKRTLAKNYFTFMIGFHNHQFWNLLFKTRLKDWSRVLMNLSPNDASTNLPSWRFHQLSIFTRMVWLFTLQRDRFGLLAKITEPNFGCPFPIYLDGHLISQDLANSVLELYSILECTSLKFDQSITVCEVGAGYGRNAFVFLKAFPKCKYFVVDIPPALHVAEEYLSAVFPEKKIQKFSCFEKYEDVEDGINRADVIFLLPHQAKMLPSKSVDLFINISSFHEMRWDQIEEYFRMVDRLTSGYFYTKQWRNVTNRLDSITLKESSYPYGADWKCILTRTTEIQPGFFEAVYAI